MSNSFPITISHIQDREKVNSSTVGRVTQALDRRTTYLKAKVDELEEKTSRIQLSSIPCSSTVKNYSFVYYNGTEVALSYIDLGNPNNPSNNPFGLAINIRMQAGNRVCDIVTHGLVEIPTAYFGNILASSSDWIQATGYWLTQSSSTAGKVTDNSAGTSHKVLFTIGKSQAGSQLVLVHSSPTFELIDHAHHVEEWELETDTHQLMFTPSDTDLLLVTVNGLIQRQGPVGGSWDKEGDPDYEVSGNILKFYKIQRYLVNEEPFDVTPLVKAYYISLVGDAKNVEALIKGQNIEFSTCSSSEDGLLKFGVVTIHSYFDPIIVDDGQCGAKSVRNLEYLPSGGTHPVTTDPIASHKTLAYMSPNVCKIESGAGIAIESTGDVPGTGIVKIHNIAHFQTYELAQPDQLVLLASNQVLYNSIYPVVEIDPEVSDEQAIVAKYTVPHDVDESFTMGLRFYYWPVTGVAGTLKLLLKVYSFKENDTLMSNSQEYLVEVPIPAVHKDRKQIFDYMFTTKVDSSGNVLHSALETEKEAALAVHLYRDETDAYSEIFRLDALRLIYRKIAV